MPDMVEGFSKVKNIVLPWRFESTGDAVELFQEAESPWTNSCESRVALRKADCILLSNLLLLC